MKIGPKNKWIEEQQQRGEKTHTHTHTQRCSISGRNSDAINKEGQANKQTWGWWGGGDEKLAEQKRIS